MRSLFLWGGAYCTGELLYLCLFCASDPQAEAVLKSGPARRSLSEALTMPHILVVSALLWWGRQKAKGLL